MSERAPRLRVAALTGAAALVTALFFGGVLPLSVADGHRGASRGRLDHVPAVRPGSSGRPKVLLGGLLNPQAYVAGGRLWVIEQTSRPGSTVVSEIMRVNPSTGHVSAVLPLGAAYQQALLARDVLWVTTGSGRRNWLWRLRPDSLRVIAKNLLPGSVAGGVSFGQFGTLAVTRGWLWVGGWDTLDRLSLKTGRASIELRMPGAQGIDVASSPSGNVLVDSEGHELARVQRRDARTGALVAQSRVYQGVTKPYIGGVTSSGVWLSEATGMMGYAQRISTRTLQPTPLSGAPPHPGITLNGIEGTNGIAARVSNNTLWITDNSGSYCGNPITGKPWAKLVLPDALRDTVLAITPTDIYFASAGPGIRGQHLNRLPISPRC
jgi:hypothetical protein